VLAVVLSKTVLPYLEHSQKQMFFSALILVSVNCEHDCL
jgi:hypothetical protein